ncbi:hypothetical protein ACG2LH_18095 [Zhouia sp. PK063]
MSSLIFSKVPVVGMELLAYLIVIAMMMDAISKEGHKDVFLIIQLYLK